jgi:hypothetical protein
MMMDQFPPEAMMGQFMPAPPPPPLPPLTEEAKNILQQWESAQAVMIEQLRFLQIRYRDSGHADDAAVIATRVRELLRRNTATTGLLTAELANEGLPTSDDPVQVPSFREEVGKTLTFAIRGRIDETVYGTTIYADHSSLASAAVHAGIVRDGQRALVKVKLLPGQNSYEGSTQNGVQSFRYGQGGGSFQVLSATVSRPNRTPSMSSYRDLVGESLTIPLVGATTGRVSGDGVYTDGSPPAAAAVHAGILGSGEFGWVRIVLMPGQSSYPGSSRNGVTSEASGAAEGSFRIERAAAPYVVQLPLGEDASRLVNVQLLRGRLDASFVVQVVGAAQGGALWGTDVYTDDSAIGMAAVHAGILKDKEMGFVRVIPMPGRDRYTSSVSNGVQSGPYGPWAGSYRLEGAGR